eukprot:jgi/Ulvmu1/4532/UM002_0258.1
MIIACMGVQAENGRCSRQNGGDAVFAQMTERALLAFLLARWQALDADMVAGHNIGCWDLQILLQRLQHHKVPMWSRIGRLKRNRMPTLSGGGNMYGGGASHVRANFHHVCLNAWEIIFRCDCLDSVTVYSCECMPPT